MSDNDRAILKLAGLKQTRAAFLLGVTDQAMSQAIRAKSIDYFTSDRLGRLAAKLRKENDPKTADTVERLALAQLSTVLGMPAGELVYTRCTPLSEVLTSTSGHAFWLPPRSAARVQEEADTLRVAIHRRTGALIIGLAGDDATSLPVIHDRVFAMDLHTVWGGELRVISLPTQPRLLLPELLLTGQGMFVRTEVGFQKLPEADAKILRQAWGGLESEQVRRYPAAPAERLTEELLRRLENPTPPPFSTVEIGLLAVLLGKLCKAARTEERPGRFMLQAVPKVIRKKFGEESAAAVQRTLETMLLESV